MGPSTPQQQWGSPQAASSPGAFPQQQSQSWGSPQAATSPGLFPDATDFFSRFVSPSSGTPGSYGIPGFDPNQKFRPGGDGNAWAQAYAQQFGKLFTAGQYGTYNGIPATPETDYYGNKIGPSNSQNKFFVPEMAFQKVQ